MAIAMNNQKNVTIVFAGGTMHHTDPEASQTIAKELASAKWYLWHGNVEQALPLIEDCYLLCDDPDIAYEKRKKFGKHLAEMISYIGNNAQLIPNYGEKYRYCETITTSFAESTVNEVVVKRMVEVTNAMVTHWSALSIADENGGS